MPRAEVYKGLLISRHRSASTRWNAKLAENCKRLRRAMSPSMVIASRSRHQLVAAGLGDEDGGGGDVLFDLLP
jgi:hypothetical protein